MNTFTVLSHALLAEIPTVQDDVVVSRQNWLSKTAFSGEKILMKHSSEKRGFCLMKLSTKMLSLPYNLNKNTFFCFLFIPTLGIHYKKSKVSQNEKQIKLHI